METIYNFSVKDADLVIDHVLNEFDYKKHNMQEYIKNSIVAGEKILSSKNFSHKPFDHLFIDNFLPIKFAKLCEKSFPNLKKYKW